MNDDEGSTEIDKTQSTGTEGPKPTMVSSLHAVQLTTYSGPLPHPETLRQFEEILPGSAKRIFNDFELQSSHRRALERKVVNSEAFRQIAGSISSGLIGLLGVAGGLWLVHEGRDISGLAAVFATLASLLGTFLYQSHKKSSEQSQVNETSHQNEPY